MAEACCPLALASQVAGISVRQLRRYIRSLEAAGVIQTRRTRRGLRVDSLRTRGERYGRVPLSAVHALQGHPELWALFAWLDDRDCGEGGASLIRVRCRDCRGMGDAPNNCRAADARTGGSWTRDYRGARARSVRSPSALERQRAGTSRVTRNRPGCVRIWPILPYPHTDRSDQSAAAARLSDHIPGLGKRHWTEIVIPVAARSLAMRSSRRRAMIPATSPSIADRGRRRDGKRTGLAL